jgi:hypothetical protein
MDLKFYRVKENPISEKQRLLFQRHKTVRSGGERDYEREMKRQRVEREQVRSEKEGVEGGGGGGAKGE